MKKMFSMLAFVSLIFCFSVSANAEDIANANAISQTKSSAVGVGQQGQEQSTNIVFPDPPAEQTMNNRGSGYRGFPDPGTVNFPGMPGFYGKPTVGAQYMKIINFLDYKDEFTVGEIENMDDTGWGDVEIMETRLLDNPAKEDLAGSIKAHTKKVEDAQLIAFISVRATDSDVTSADILGVIAKRAREIGGNAFHVNGDGVERVMKASGWGIGISGTRATLASDEMSGTVASPALGYSAGQAGYKDFPWLQVFVLKTVQ